MLKKKRVKKAARRTVATRTFSEWDGLEQYVDVDDSELESDLSEGEVSRRGQRC